MRLHAQLLAHTQQVSMNNRMRVRDGFKGHRLGSIDSTKSALLEAPYVWHANETRAQERSMA